MSKKNKIFSKNLEKIYSLFKAGFFLNFSFCYYIIECDFLHTFFIYEYPVSYFF